MMTKQDTNTNAGLQAEIKVERFIWIFASKWLRAKIAEKLNDFWPGLPKTLYTYDIEKPNGRRDPTPENDTIPDLTGPKMPVTMPAEKRKRKSPHPTGPMELGTSQMPSQERKKRKLPQPTGVRDPKCKRCARLGYTCRLQARGKACVSCATVKIKCEEIDLPGPAFSELAISKPALSQPALSSPAFSQPAFSQQASSRPALRTPRMIPNLAAALLAELGARPRSDDEDRSYTPQEGDSREDRSIPPESGDGLVELQDEAPGTGISRGEFEDLQAQVADLRREVLYFLPRLETTNRELSERLRKAEQLLADNQVPAHGEAPAFSPPAFPVLNESPNRPAQDVEMVDESLAQVLAAGVSVPTMVPPPPPPAVHLLPPTPQTSQDLLDAVDVPGTSQSISRSRSASLADPRRSPRFETPTRSRSGTPIVNVRRSPRLGK